MGENKIELNPEITNKEIKEVFEGVIYLKQKLQAYQIYFPLFFNNYKDKSIENIVIRNAILESALLSIRISYEFLFKYELLGSKSQNLNDSFKDKRFKDDVTAEYYFNNPENWITIKEDRNIEFDKINSLINKDDLNKKLFHFTFSIKQDWNIMPAMNLLINTLNLFLYYQDKIVCKNGLTQEEIRIVEGEGK